MNTTAFDLLRDPRKNKGTGFTQEERDHYGLNGLLPDVVESLIKQVQRADEQVGQLEKPINQYTYLSQLLDNNERICFKLVMDDPFGPVKYRGKSFIPGQGSNVYIFPAIGLAVFATEARRLTDDLFITAAVALSEQVTDEDFEGGLIYPPVDKILYVSLQIAIAVAAKIFELGLAGIDKPEDIASFVKSKMYKPVYL